MEARKPRTSTSSFGVSRRENHDAAGFYARFSPPDVSDDAQVSNRKAIDEIFCGDARNMPEIDDASVALVVTSPPYFAGKEYEEALGEGHVPANYLEYLQMLEEVFAECVDKLEPGGRIAVNVANLGRKPYRSLSADVIAILQDRLQLLLRGEVIWQKARGSAGSCAWGSFQKPGNPVLRDLTERVIIACKGRFDRAIGGRKRHAAGLPSEASASRDEFMEATTDVWEFASESARRVGHPAPFPVELPERLIHLHTYIGDLVLDPFMGSGTTAVAAIRTGRHYAGYDTDPEYVERARERAGIAAEITTKRRVVVPAVPTPVPDGANPLTLAIEQGRAAKEIAEIALLAARFDSIEKRPNISTGVDFTFRAADAGGNAWTFDVCGALTTSKSGLNRTDTLLREIGRATVARQADPDTPFVILAIGVPAPDSAIAIMLTAQIGPDKPIEAVIDLLDDGALDRLSELANLSA